MTFQDNNFDIGGGATFSTISELLEHYSRNPMVDQAGTVVHLKQVNINISSAAVTVR